MSWAFKEGQRVECVNDRLWADRDGRLAAVVAPMSGCVYTVNGLRLDRGEVMLILAEFDPLHLWWSGVFLPVQESDVDVFRAVLAPRPRVSEPA